MKARGSASILVIQEQQANQAQPSIEQQAVEAKPASFSQEPRRGMNWFAIERNILNGVLGGTAVATATYPLDVLLTRKQVRVTPTKMGAFGFIYANFKALSLGLLKSMQLSWRRNVVVSQREHVHDNVDHAMTEIGSKSSSSQRVVATLATGGIIGYTDTLFTNGPRNYRTLNAVGIIPEFASMKDRYNFYKIAFSANVTRNCLNASFCLAAGTIWSPVVNQHIPSNQYPLTNLFMSNFIAGVFSGICITPLDVIAKMMIYDANLQTFKAPTAWHEAKKLYMAEGMCPFFRGTRLNIVSSCVVFGILNGINFDEYSVFLLSILPQFNEPKTPKTSPTLFTPAEAVPIKIKAQQATPITEEVQDTSNLSKPTV